MSIVDVNSLLGEISAESPSGDDLEYDPAFGAIERASQGKAEQEFGDSTNPSEPADWRAVRDQSIELLGRTKDLRAGVYLARALVNTDGYEGLGDGLALIRGLLERYWGSVHPQLDAEDNDDSTYRVNTIATLCDREAVLNSVLNANLVSSRAMGKFSLRSIQIARGENLEPEKEGESVPDMATIDAAFMDANLEELKATSDALTRCIGDLSAIDVVLMEKLGSTEAPDISALPSLLKQSQSVMSDQLARRGVVSESDKDIASEEGVAEVTPNQQGSGEIRTREDAIRMMEKISEYFQRNEPSSPIPILMHRAKRLVSMSFIDILRDLAPDGVSQAENIGGLGD